MTVKISIRDLSRHEQEQLQRSKSFDELAEDLVVDEFGLEVDRVDWYDAVHPNTDAKTQTKSTSSTVGQSYPGDGRFRVWEEQHRSLTTSEGQAVAWYAFVLLHEDEGEIWIRRMKPTTVTQIVRERGGWNASGHSSYDRQHKIPWPEVFQR